MNEFEKINRAYNDVFQEGQLSIGVVVPIEHYAQGPVPQMQDHLERVQLIEQLGYKALWVRDIPFNVPSFGDAGQTYDPFTYLGYLAARTKDIALAVGSIALPLHHPVHVAKSAATIDQLSDGRLILGVASGDRFDEYPAMGVEFEKRGELFREAFNYLRNAASDFPMKKPGHYGELHGHIDILPKPTAHKLPLLLTGYSRQSLEWNAAHADGWMSYPKNVHQQYYTIAKWRELVAQSASYNKPFMQPLYIQLQKDDDFKPLPIPLGIRTGVNYLVDYLRQAQEIGVNHVALNLRFNEMDTVQTLAYLAEKVLPHFHINLKAATQA